MMNQKVIEKLLKAKTFQEFQQIAIENEVVEFKDIGEDALRHMTQLMHQAISDSESPLHHTDPLKKKYSSS